MQALGGLTGKAQVAIRPSCNRQRVPVVAAVKDGSEDSGLKDLKDPESKFRRFGPNFGARYKIDAPMQWLEDAPRVRVRSMEDRKLEELLEVAVLNARLSGDVDPWKARRRLDYLKLRRRNWEAIYHFVSETDAVVTLELIEEANRKVEEALMESNQGRTSVHAMQKKLMSLQQEVEQAANKLATTQAKVEQNLRRVNQLKAEAAKLERLKAAAPSASASKGSSATLTKEAPATRPGDATPSTSYASAAAAATAALKAASKSRPGRGLQSSLEMEDALRNFWYPAEFSKKLGPNMMVPFDLFGEPWVMFRDERGQAACIKDSCAHRSCPLSLGKVIDGQVQCAYHGWEFNAEGTCTKMPSTAFCRNVAVASLPCVEKDGFIWVWPGDGLPDEVPDFLAPPKGYKVHAEIFVDVPVEHGLLVENLLDLAHAPFTHTTTFARGWPVPDAVRFNATKMLSGNWDPYPIDMSFHPPCVTESLIGLAKPGQVERGSSARACKNHLHQVHVCMPARKGHTRLLYRMSLDFMNWLQYIPFIDQFWVKIAAQVLGEDLVLVTGQQDRMQRGDDTWANPMAYDKLAVRYRRWRNSVAAGDLEESKCHAAAARMSAGTLFTDDGCEVTSAVEFYSQAAPEALISVDEEARILNIRQNP
uniref:Rieske domain-containing protein n=1 Tax=Chlamydomonas leiostraca TaxID=1034604 RepID=A0A7S0RR27_9CHLO|mmetsp:Transcript_29161/g.74409  ORF Transcript_29161/g.74409 Transcript_29161/m.74409 type:complete len:648 (+) Transcript_29161:193-2136(+)|eukprot:CAMPEP_0202858858 /NCGR_PEP_ID=MMETSP1391-20130828/1208_1 /ASSEMBLY_ACC=CAM_ASM_000867 /TAXON_ID=1034604 /ORGANISM="Chlamydomonas leiostraca, Strain SAG 11-49" /LENGTH=647 /DNA_ID=CAMNT_0049537823 /DNA_START=160 /DNA_END=2103 /DNA_ORIENTATION=-